MVQPASKSIAAKAADYEGVSEGEAQGWSAGGWIWNTVDPAVEVSVDVFGAGMFMRVAAGQSRPDLAAAGKRGGNCWFTAPLAGDTSRSRSRAEFVLLAGTGHRLRDVGEGSQALVEDWLDGQAAEVRFSVLAQRLNYGFTRTVLTQGEVSSLLEELGDRCFDLVDLAAALSQRARRQAPQAPAAHAAPPPAYSNGFQRPGGMPPPPLPTGEAFTFG